MSDNERVPTHDETPPRKKQIARMAWTLAAVAAAIYLAYIGYFVGSAMK